jgi:hypothetical protein
MAVPSEDYSRQPPCSARLFVKGERPRTHRAKKKIMKTKTKLDSELQNRTAQRSENTAELPKLDLNRRNQNRALPMESLLNLIRKEAPDFWNVAEVVGKWVWIQFEGKQPREITAILSQLGFHWNNRRQVWQHPCGQVTRRADFDPRRKYRSFFPADAKPA